MSSRLALKLIGSLWLGALLGALAAFVTQILLARELGPREYGIFSSIIAFMALLTPLIGLGIPQFWLKIYGLEGTEAGRWLKGSFKALCLSSIAIFSIVFLWLTAFERESSYFFTILLFLFFLLSQLFVELLSSRYQLEGKFRVLALWQLFPHFLRLTVLLILLFLVGENFDLFNVSWAYAIASIPLIVFGWHGLSTMRKNSFTLEGHKRLYTEPTTIVTPGGFDVLKSSWPFGLAAFFQIIYYQSDIILVKYLDGEHAAGIYSVAFSIMAAIFLLPAVIYQKFLLPKFHRWAHHDTARFYQVYKLGNKAMALVGLLVMVGLWSSAFWLIPFVFGSEYRGSVVVLNVLALSIPVMYLAFNSGATLVTKDNMLKKVRYMGFVACINIALNSLLIPTYGELGAAIATVLSNTVLWFFYYFSTRKYVFGEGGAA
jgi:O-antigen/teichoic acid export membrane protein